MKKLLMYLFIVLGLFLVSCDKDPIDPDDPDPPPPPPTEKKAQVTVKIGPLPEDCLEFHPTIILFRDSSGHFTGNLVDSHYKYPEFTYSFSQEHAKKYLGKRIELYFDAVRVFPPGSTWGMLALITIDPLKESQEIYIEIPDRDE